MKIAVTGGAGFIGSALVRHLIRNTDHAVLNIDKLTYAGNLESIAAEAKNRRYQFAQIDICDRPALDKAFASFQPDAVMHLAAESHVDRSIDGPDTFMQTNIIGTYRLLEAARTHWSKLPEDCQATFRFLHVSTDEVFGSLGDKGFFVEDTPYSPNSPYSASKASSDHLVRSWHHTFGLPVVTTNCSNNYGPYQFPEKLIPVIVIKAMSGQPLPVYGAGANIRDWLFVDDHVKAMLTVLRKGRLGETYNIGGHNEIKNLDVVHIICDILDDLLPNSPHRPHRNLITFVKDRPGHDLRYAIDAGKIECELGWKPEQTFETGIRETVVWYLENETWWGRVLDGSYRMERLGQI